MNALLRCVAGAVRERAVEIAVIAALGAATVFVTWWFAGPLGFAAGWWIAAELRLRRSRRTVPASTARAEMALTEVVSEAAESPSERVSAGQQDEGRAGA
ncbi:hypothetical protein [Pseudonocardia sp. ICBG1142]|uniref:hypothetical protein n=1 Tax=Pseudonocardia sp. ICBG1142 TaxID=2846760 RepID=UPI001CF6070C|nr:hypothetical protein [Pseudonocardia sp. ICBG1142]